MLEIKDNGEINASYFIRNTVFQDQEATQFISDIIKPANSINILYNSMRSIILSCANQKFIIKIYKSKSKEHETEIYASKLFASDKEDIFSKFTGSFQCDQFTILVTEYCGRDAFEIMNSPSFHLEKHNDVAVEFAITAIKAVDIIHSYDWTHCDIKPENMVYNFTEQKWRVIDFGLSLHKKDNGRRAGTPPFIPPSAAFGIASNINHIVRIECDRYAAALSILTFCGIVESYTKKCAKCVAQLQTKRKCKPNCGELIIVPIELLENIANNRFPPSVLEDIVDPHLRTLCKHAARIAMASLYHQRFNKMFVWNAVTCHCAAFGVNNGNEDTNITPSIDTAWIGMRDAIETILSRNV